MTSVCNSCLGYHLCLKAHDLCAWHIDRFWPYYVLYTSVFRHGQGHWEKSVIFFSISLKMSRSVGEKCDIFSHIIKNVKVIWRKVLIFISIFKMCIFLNAMKDVAIVTQLDITTNACFRYWWEQLTMSKCDDLNLSYVVCIFWTQCMHDVFIHALWWERKEGKVNRTQYYKWYVMI